MSLPADRHKPEGIPPPIRDDPTDYNLRNMDYETEYTRRSGDSSPDAPEQPPLRPAEPDTEQELDNSGKANDSEKTTSPKPQSKRGVRFWLIMVALCAGAILSATDGTVMSTALPTIVNELGGGDLAVWAVNGYFLTSTALQPFYGQAANVLGRRYPLIFSVIIFIVGIGIASGANGMPTLVAGRLVQGIGGAGLNMLVELIVCDIVPLRERGNFMAIIMSSVAVGSSIGPFIGGIIVQRTTWRWVFYLNFPIGGITLLLLALFLQVGYKKESTVIEKVKRIDWVGNFLFVSSVVAILIAVTWAGSVYSWSSYHVLAPLIVGFVGLVVFQIFECTSLCVEPVIPPQLFQNRTTLIAMILTFIHSSLAIWMIYFLPVYFQAVLRSSPARSGVQLLPTVLIFVPGAVAGGVLLAKFGRYRPIHLIGFAIMTVGLGCFTLLEESSSTAVWVTLQIVFSLGGGMVIATLLPAVQASLSDADSATSTGTWAFIRGFGTIWGVTIPSVIFNNQFNNRLDQISDAGTRAALAGSQAYAHATNTFINSLSGGVQIEVIGVYTASLKVVWEVAIAISGFGFLLVFLEKEIKLRTEVETEYGIKEKTKTQTDPEASAAASP